MFSRRGRPPRAEGELVKNASEAKLATQEGRPFDRPAERGLKESERVNFQVRLFGHTPKESTQIKNLRPKLCRAASCISMKRSKVYVCPSAYIGLPITLLEADHRGGCSFLLSPS
jgi:hypothetical protein